MDRAVALKRLKAALGPKLYYRVGESVSDQDRREEARAKRAAAKERIAEIDARVAEIIAAIPEVQELRAEKRELRKQEEQAQHGAHYKKFQAGVNKGWCVEIVAEGDTWADVVAQVEARQPSA